MNAQSLHDDMIVFDGLNISKWDRSVFEDMRAGGVSGANCTCSIWEGFQATMDNIAEWKAWFREHGDLLLQAHSTGDIRGAKQAGRTAIVLGFQNATAFEDNLGYIQLFKDLGVGIVQLCYNTQNMIGTGCYERDGGLSGFGYEVVAEMNRAGIMVDLSHVGAETSEDAIRASTKPVCYSHCLPQALKDHPRNKSDEQLKFIADADGFIGVTMFPPFLRRGTEASVDDYVEAIDHVLNVAGEDAVGIGTDFTQGYGDEFFQWLVHDKGRARRLTDFGPVINPEGIRTIAEFPNLTAAMDRAGWAERRIRKVMGENWLRVLAEVWGE